MSATSLRRWLQEASALTPVVTELRFPGEAVFAKAGGSFGGRIQVYGEVSAVFEKLDTG